MAKRTRTTEQLDLEACQYLMASIERAAGDLASYGSDFVGRSWITEKDTSIQVSEIYRDTVQSLRAAYRRLSEAEDILGHELGAVALPVKPGIIRKMLLLGSGG